MFKLYQIKEINENLEKLELEIKDLKNLELSKKKLDEQQVFLIHNFDNIKH